MKTLGQRIRELREERDLSLRELATLIGVSAVFMSDVELDRRYPSDKHMSAVAQALQSSLADLKKNDTRPPLREFRKATHANPEFGFAFRQVMEKQVSPQELLEFVQRRDNRPAENQRDA